jgi:nicotinate-nucleotide adenylyltransferase
MKIGVFGGTFNPVHYGHLRAAEEAREMLGLEKVLFVPSGNPPLKSLDLADAGQRYEMVRQAVAGNRFFEAIDIECASPEKSYTVHTIERLQEMFPGASLYFMLGIDAFIDLPNWYMPEKLVSMVNFAVLSRPWSTFSDLLASPHMKVDTAKMQELDHCRSGSFSVALPSGREAVLVRTTPIAIASTDIRRRIKEGLSVKYLLPEEVESFIISNRIYFSDR